MDGVNGLVLSPRGDRLAILTEAAEDKNTVRLYDTVGGGFVGEPIPQAAEQPEFSSDGRLFVTSTSDSNDAAKDSLSLWRSSDGTLLAPPVVGVQRWSFDPFGTVAVLGEDHVLRIWRTEDSQILARVDDVLEWDQSAEVLVTQGQDGTVEVRKLGTGEAPRTILGPGSHVQSVALDEDGSILLTAVTMPGPRQTEDSPNVGRVQIWRTAAARLPPAAIDDVNLDAADSWTFTADGRQLIVETLEHGRGIRLLRTWRADQGWAREPLLRNVTSWSLLAGGRVAALGPIDPRTNRGRLTILNSDTGKTVGVGLDGVEEVSATDGSRVLVRVSAGDGQEKQTTLQVVDGGLGEVMLRVPDAGGSQLLAGGRVLGTTTNTAPNSVETVLWDVSTHHRLATLPGVDVSDTATWFYQDGQQFILTANARSGRAGESDGRLRRVMDGVQYGDRIQLFEGWEVTDDASTLVSYEDDIVRVWGTCSGTGAPG